MARTFISPSKYVQGSGERVLEVAKLACAPNDTLHNMPFEVAPEKVANAMRASDVCGRAAL